MNILKYILPHGLVNYIERKQLEKHCLSDEKTIRKNSVPFFYSEGSLNCIEALLSQNCSEWHAGTKKGYHYYRVFSKGISKLRAVPDEIFHDTYVYRGYTQREALLKALAALSTKQDFSVEFDKDKD
jgi:hypothetical protein